MTQTLDGDILRVWLIGGTGIHTRLKISRPHGLAGSSPASATIFKILIKEGIMKKAAQWLFTLVVFYFWINAMADNPQEVEDFRRQMNSLVDDARAAARELLS